MLSPMLSPEDARRIVEAYRECAGNATARLKTMLDQVHEAQVDETEELQTRISHLIAQVDALSSMVQSTDIAHTFNAAYRREA